MELRREIGVGGAMLMGLGSIVGTGVFVSIGIAADVAGPSVLVAIFLASLVAICNGLSSAQLAANHPVSGGTYEYGYRWLSPWIGFMAGWMFLCAKSASAATAALGFAGYLMLATHLERSLVVPVALITLGLLTGVVLLGIRRSNLVNSFIVTITLAALAFFVVAGLPAARSNAAENLTPFFAGGARGLLEATALMFVAYTGYGRIATLGEEVRDPRRSIPRAVMATLIVSMALYASVGFVGVAVIGGAEFGAAARDTLAPLEFVAGRFRIPGARMILSVAAMTAMLGVLLNLLLGLSRVVLAMGRRRDLPAAVAHITDKTAVPSIATLVVAAVIGGLVMMGDVRLTWSFSAFTVLVYYAITNLCVLRLPAAERLFPVWPAVIGLAACLFLAFWVDPFVWIAGIGLGVAGSAWFAVADRRRRSPPAAT